LIDEAPAFFRVLTKTWPGRVVIITARNFEESKWLYSSRTAGDLVAAADAWGDRLYVLLGDAVAAGLPAERILDEVHRSNMTKAVRASTATGKGKKAAAFVPLDIGRALDG
jgi:predicted HAD superfamily Cof-like phosphohydrolase